MLNESYIEQKTGVSLTTDTGSGMRFLRRYGWGDGGTGGMY